MAGREGTRAATLLSWFRYLLVLALVIGAAAEISLRIFTNKSSSLYIGRPSSKIYDPITVERNTPLLEVRGIKSNELGYIAPLGLPFEKPDGEIRLIYLGDSITRSPVDLVYPRQVEQILESERGLRVQTVNTAVPGFAAENALALLESETSKFEADYLFVLLGWNNLGQYGPEGMAYKRKRAGYELSTLERIFSLFYLERLAYGAHRSLRDRYQPTRNAELSPADRALYENFHPHYFEDLLRRILVLGKARYPHVYVLNLPSVTNPDPTDAELAKIRFPVGMDRNVRKLHFLLGKYNAVIADVAAREGVELIDVHSLFGTRKEREQLANMSHPDGRGHRRIAELIAREVESTQPANTLLSSPASAPGPE